MLNIHLQQGSIPPCWQGTGKSIASKDVYPRLFVRMQHSYSKFKYVHQCKFRFWQFSVVSLCEVVSRNKCKRFQNNAFQEHTWLGAIKRINSSSSETCEWNEHAFKFETANFQVDVWLHETWMVKCEKRKLLTQTHDQICSPGTRWLICTSLFELVVQAWDFTGFQETRPGKCFHVTPVIVQ